MRIALITVFYNANYGAVLQAYALSKTIQEISKRECYLVDYRRQKIINMFRFSIFDIDVYGNRSITKNSIKRTIKQLINPMGTIVRFKKFEEFRNKYMNISPKTYYRRDDIDLPDTSTVFLGSDQIWNPDITQGFDDVYFGRMADNNKFIVSYAASLGRIKFNKQEREELKELLNNVDVISVREEEGAEIVRALTNRPVICVPDPTILLDREHWEWLALHNKTESSKYVLVYMLSYNKKVIDLAYKISHFLNCKIILFDSGSLKRIKGMKQKKHYGPRQFLKYVLDAEYIVTNSFHGTVFSVIFNKQFFTIPHETRGSRMIDFCRKLGLEDRIAYGNRTINLSDIEKYIDYDIVQPKLKELKQVGLDYIKRVLKEAGYGK